MKEVITLFRPTGEGGHQEPREYVAVDALLSDAAIDEALRAAWTIAISTLPNQQHYDEDDVEDMRKGIAAAVAAVRAADNPTMEDANDA